MSSITRDVCRACGHKMTSEEIACPRCRVPRRGDVNFPMIAAYSVFLALMLIGGALALFYLRGATHIR